MVRLFSYIILRAQLYQDLMEVMDMLESIVVFV